MVPEVKTITPEYIATQQERFNAAAQIFGQTYSRRQNIFSAGTDLIRRITGRPTTTQEIIQAAGDLQEARLNLAETRARDAAQNATSDALYRQVLANHFAQEYLATGEEVLAATQVENTNLGHIDNVYRANMNPGGSSLRLAGGLGLILAAGPLNWIQGPNGVTATEVGIFLGATGVLDTARQIMLQTFQRSRVGLALASTANLIRRQASIHEGQITGDEIENAQLVNQVLQGRLAQETLDQLERDEIIRPNFINPDILKQRDSLRNRSSRYDHLLELVRARDTARVSRLTRTLLYTALAVGLIYVHASRPEYCGERTFPNPDRFTESITEGATGLSSWKGVAENEWFKRIYGVDFDRTNPQHRIMFDTTYDLDKEGNDRLVDDITRQLKRKNPQIRSVTRDLFRHGIMNEICEGELNIIIDNPFRW